jgi:uncharacterized protein YjiS (DUF1127 family)
MSNRLGTVALAVAGARLSAATAPRTVGGIFADAIAALFRTVRNGRLRRQTELALYGLSDTTLRDIGIHRSEIRSVAAGLAAGGSVNRRGNH